MRRALRLAGTLLIVAGVLSLGWAVLVWQWQDPFTALYTHVQQGRLAAQLDREFADFRAAGSRAAGSDRIARKSARTATLEARAAALATARRTAAADAAAFRRALHPGQPIGRLLVPRLGLRIVVVQGTDHESLKKGPGHYVGSYLPGQGQLIYIAGHRTTYLAPFSHIDRLRPGDPITLELPYGTFRYVVTRHRIVLANDLAVLRSHGREVLILQACHPRFFATHRYLVYARPVSMTLLHGRPIPLAPTAPAAGGVRPPS